MKSGMDTSDIESLKKCIERIGKLPQKCVNSAARQGARVLLLKARQNAPYESGNLEKVDPSELQTPPGKFCKINGCGVESGRPR